MTRNKIEKLQKEYSKPQITKWEKQKKTQFWTLIIGVAVIIVVFALVGAGYYVETWQPAHQTILIVNGTKFNTSDFASVLRAISQGSASNVDNYAGYVIPTLEQAEEIKQAAAKLNITVSDSEVNSYMTSQKYPAGYQPFARSQLLSQKLVKNYFSAQVEKTADQRDVQAMLLESVSQANDISSQLNDTNFSDLATANSLDAVTQGKKGELGEHPQVIFPSLLNRSSIVGDTAFSLENGQVSQPVYDPNVQKSEGYWLIMPIEVGTGANAGKTNFRVMLLNSQEEALQIKSMLDAISDPTQKAARFMDIAKMKTGYSNASNGVLGFTAKGTIGAAFDAVAFNLKMGELSNPVKDTTQNTTGGYWLVKVTKIDAGKALSADDTNTLAQQKFNDWFTQVQKDYTDKVKDLSNAKNLAWAVAKAKQGLSS